MLSSHEVLQRRYRIVRLIGEGSMGAVYEAVDESFGEPVAVKEVQYELTGSINKNQLESLKNGFKREAMSLAKARHPAVPYVRDYFSYRERQYVVIDMVEGDDLGHMLAERGTPFPVDVVLDWSDQILDALDYLHNLDPPIVHGDIKPQNLKITPCGKLMLLDLEIAKTVDIVAFAVQSSDLEFTALNYLPFEKVLRVIDPSFREFVLLKHKERAAGVLEQSCDARSDVYMVGATLYYLLTNRPASDIVKRALDTWEGKHDPLPDPSDIVPEIAAPIAECILKALEIDRDDRFTSASAMRSALHQAAIRDSQPEEKEAVSAPITVENGHSNGTQDRSAEPESLQVAEPVIDIAEIVPVTTKLGHELARATAPLMFLPDLRTVPRIPILDIGKVHDLNEIKDLPNTESKRAITEVITQNEFAGETEIKTEPETEAADNNELPPRTGYETAVIRDVELRGIREIVNEPQPAAPPVVPFEPPSTKPIDKVPISVTPTPVSIKAQSPASVTNGHTKTVKRKKRTKPVAVLLWSGVVSAVSTAAKGAGAYRSRVRVPLWITLTAAAAVLTVLGIVVLVWLLSLGKPATDITAGTATQKRSAVPQAVETTVTEPPKPQLPEPQSQANPPAPAQEQRLTTEATESQSLPRDEKPKRSANQTTTQKQAADQPQTTKSNTANVQPSPKPKEDKKKVTVDDLINDN